MAGHSQAELAQLTVNVPRGQDGCWQIMRALDAKGAPFTMCDVEGETNGPRRAIELYMQRLLRGGFLKVVGTRPVDRSPVKERLFRLVKKPVATPRLRNDGTPVPASAQTRLWRSMRTPSGRVFAARDIAFEASLPGAAVPVRTAQRYVNQLVIAGYLACLNGGYRLKPSMNSGPLPPSVLKIEAVWDRNLERLIGPAAVRDDSEAA